jgi:hypothetical protein
MMFIGYGLFRSELWVQNEKASAAGRGSPLFLYLV